MSKLSLFSPKAPETCPQCGAPLAMRQGQHGVFIGCSAYPQCDYHRALKTQSASHVVTVLDGQICPLCQAGLVLRQGRFGMFICCADYPHCSHSESVNKSESVNNSADTINHPETADNGDKPVATVRCPQCEKGHLVTRHSRFGKPFYGCSRYPACQFAVKLKPVVGECAWCHYPLLLEKTTSQGVKRCCASKQCGKLVEE